VTGLPEVTGRIVVQGNGAIIQRTGAAEFRILDVGAAGDLTLDRVTIKGGKVTFTSVPAPFFSDGGAGIRVLGSGKLTITNGTVTQNTCTGAVCLGGGILAYDDVSQGDAGRQQHENAAQGALTRRVADAVLRWNRRRG
jgi:hypothetical protein